ncbi:putative disease resistance protein RPP1, partial [Mucuna pruriens]
MSCGQSLRGCVLVGSTGRVSIHRYNHVKHCTCLGQRCPASDIPKYSSGSAIKRSYYCLEAKEPKALANRSLVDKENLTRAGTADAISSSPSSFPPHLGQEHGMFLPFDLLSIIDVDFNSFHGESMPSSKSKTQWRYDELLNFRGGDIRSIFVSHLHSTLSNTGTHTFIDVGLQKGQKLGPELLPAIEGSR